jgi:uncharacterized protein
MHIINMTTVVKVTVKNRQKEIPIETNLSQKSDLKPDVEVGVLLTHGAGGDCSSGNLPAYAQIFANAGFPCLRFTCRGPLAHRVAVAKELLLGQNFPSSLPKVTKWIVAGHSMGARVAAQLAADLPALVIASLFFSYPLHPPGEPEKLRDDPLTSITLPLLFIRGTKDPFCTEKPWKEVFKRLQSELLEVHSVDGGGHGLEVSQKGGQGKDEVIDGVSDAVKEFLIKIVKDSKKDKGPSTSTGKRKKQPPAAPVAKTSPKKKAKKKR